METFQDIGLCYGLKCQTEGDVFWIIYSAELVHILTDNLLDSVHTSFIALAVSKG
jgi:hypothetical protein